MYEVVNLINISKKKKRNYPAEFGGCLGISKVILNNLNKCSNHSYKVIDFKYKLPLNNEVTVISVLLHLNGNFDTNNFSFYASHSFSPKPGNYKVSFELTVIDILTIPHKTNSRAFNIT